jgi:hypothetical protein
MSVAALGLTLTVASRMFLMEPCLTPSQEQQVCAQAVGHSLHLVSLVVNRGAAQVLEQCQTARGLGCSVCLAL